MRNGQVATMSIEYLALRDCVPQSRAGIDAFMQSLKRMGALDQLPAELPDSTPIGWVVDGPNGPVEKEIPVGELRMQRAEFQASGAACKGCPLNATTDGKAPFGCYAAVQYPIAAVEEKWLFGVAIDLASGKAPDKRNLLAMLLPEALLDKKIPPGWVAGSRKRPGNPNAPPPLNIGLWELKTPLTYSEGSFFKKRTMTSDQLFTALTADEMPETLAAMAAQFLGEASTRFQEHGPPPELAGAVNQWVDVAKLLHAVANTKAVVRCIP